MKIYNKISAWMLSILAAGMLVSPLTRADDDRERVDVIIQAGSESDTISEWVESNGGAVRYRYQNVSALAVSIPASQLTALSQVVGVALVERDRLFNLHDDLGRDPEGLPEALAQVDPSEYEVEALDPGTEIAADALSANAVIADGYANYIYSGAVSVWPQIGKGAGSVVAVVDSGVARNAPLFNAVIGAPGFPNGYNAYPDGFAATDPSNFWHGTVVAEVIAGSATVTISSPANPLYKAIAAYLPLCRPVVPGSKMTVFFKGQAPEARIYPVKVFPHSGAGTPTSVILDGLDHVLTLKKTGLLDIDIVNLSLGGPTVADGLNTLDRFLAELTTANILVVTSAGNDGPAPNSVGSPATSFSALRVGGLDYPETSRVYYEYLGLISKDKAPGMAMIMRPTDEVRVANFSARGPLSDGRLGPEISALGLWNFGLTPGNALTWVSGTSFSAPAVAGAAALLNSYWESLGNETAPGILRNVLLSGANPNLVGAQWSDANAQGYGALDVVAALNNLKNNFLAAPPLKDGGRLQANILVDVERHDEEGSSHDSEESHGVASGETRDKITETRSNQGESDSRKTESKTKETESSDKVATARPRDTDAKGKGTESKTREAEVKDAEEESVRSKIWESGVVTLGPAQTYDTVLAIGEKTSQVTVEVFDIQAPNNLARAIYPNALEVHVQSAKRGAFAQPVARYWYPYVQGAAFTVDIADGLWTFAGTPVASQPMEPGLMKITLAGDYVNESPVSFKMRVTRVSGLKEHEEPIAEGDLLMGGKRTIAIDIPEGTKAATLDLCWEHDWSRFPTSDFDMLVQDAAGATVSTAGSTLNAPERTILTNPAPGRYYVVVSASEVYTEDSFKLYMTLQ